MKVLVGGPIECGHRHRVLDMFQTLTTEVLQLGSRVGYQSESINAKGVTTEMVDDLRAEFETLRAHVTF